MAIPNHLINNFDSRTSANFEDDYSSDVPAKYMNCFNVNDEMGVIQTEEIDPEETQNLFDIANMEWEQYIPGVIDLPKEKAPQQPQALKRPPLVSMSTLDNGSRSTTPNGG